MRSSRSPRFVAAVALVSAGRYSAVRQSLAKIDVLGLRKHVAEDVESRAPNLNMAWGMLRETRQPDDWAKSYRVWLGKVS